VRKIHLDRAERPLREEGVRGETRPEVHEDGAGGLRDEGLETREEEPVPERELQSVERVDLS
jgi:hypothetical protein